MYAPQKRLPLAAFLLNRLIRLSKWANRLIPLKRSKSKPMLTTQLQLRRVDRSPNLNPCAHLKLKIYLRIMPNLRFTCHDMSQNYQVRTRQ